MDLFLPRDVCTNDSGLGLCNCTYSPPPFKLIFPEIPTSPLPTTPIGTQPSTSHRLSTTEHKLSTTQHTLSTTQNVLSTTQHVVSTAPHHLPKLLTFEIIVIIIACIICVAVLVMLVVYFIRKTKTKSESKRNLTCEIGTSLEISDQYQPDKMGISNPSMADEQEESSNGDRGFTRDKNTITGERHNADDKMSKYPEQNSTLKTDFEQGSDAKIDLMENTKL